MKIATCEHQEVVATGTNNDQVEAACAICGQERRYIDGDEFSEVITKLGYIDGAVVIPPPKTKFDITPEEHRLLTAGWDIINKRAEASGTVVEPEPEPIVVKPPSRPRQPSAKQRRLDNHREEILADYGQMTIADLQRKWGMPTGSFYRVKKRWEREGFTIPTSYADKPEETTEPVPEPEVKPKRRYSKRRLLPYWRKHRKEVIADYSSMTIIQFLKKWHLSSRGWMDVREGLKIPKKSIPLGEQPVTLPDFPAFNNNWLAATQVEWFKSYVELKKLEATCK